jgi:hypothetical protein
MEIRRISFVRIKKKLNKVDKKKEIISKFLKEQMEMTVMMDKMVIMEVIS